MPNLYSIPAGQPAAALAAAHILARVPADALSQAMIFVPNRRSASVMRSALQQQLGGKAALLPRILPLAESDEALLHLLGDKALALLAAIPPAMPESQQRYLLTEQILAFEKRRMGGVTLHYALTLADALMALQEQAVRAGTAITQEKLRQLVHADFATHWKQALLFLGILTDTWPEIEREEGMTIRAAREVALLHALADAWLEQPPQIPVFAVGSTGSQPATARLLQVIAKLPNGQVLLPGLDSAMGEEEWTTIAAGHPLFHVKALLDHWPVKPAQVAPLAKCSRSVWMDALAPTAQIANWRNMSAPTANPIRFIPCAHPEEEARVISLLLRETLESATARVALITPDEGLMARVAAHMKRHAILVDRLNAGTLASTMTGNLWISLMAAITQPERQLRIRELLHHPLMTVDSGLLAGLEKGWHGVNRKRAGQLPRHEATLHEHPHYAALAQLVKTIAQLSGQRQRASAWVEALKALLAPWVRSSGEGHEAVSEQLDLLRDADRFGSCDAEDFAALLSERLATKRRDGGINSHPRLFMLTPVEARLQEFDRVIFATMQESIWPGIASTNPWLNIAAQTALGLPAAADAVSRMAHDVLMLGSGGDIFLTYPERDGGAPVARSRFIERLVTFYASHGIVESSLSAHHYIEWARALEASTHYAPEGEMFARPAASERPHRLPVTDLDKLFTDPFAIYARHVLGLRRREEIDAAPEASDFGSLAHQAIEALTRHWNNVHRPASAEELSHIAEQALRDFSQKPNIDLFWRARLLGGLRYINQLEAARRVDVLDVTPEQTIEGALPLAGGQSMQLHGRIDRLELRNGRATVIDYKTGDIPSEKAILNGQALQLLAYSMLLAQNGVVPEAIEYWALPRLGDEGELRHLDTGADRLAEMQQRLCAALDQMLDEQTPFLARPVASGADARFGNDYDGISRYDEWAG